MAEFAGSNPLQFNAARLSLRMWPLMLLFSFFFHSPEHLTTSLTQIFLWQCWVEALSKVLAQDYSCLTFYWFKKNVLNLMHDCLYQPMTLELPFACENTRDPSCCYAYLCLKWFSNLDGCNIFISIFLMCLSSPLKPYVMFLLTYKTDKK